MKYKLKNADQIIELDNIIHVFKDTFGMDKAKQFPRISIKYYNGQEVTVVYPHDDQYHGHSSRNHVLRDIDFNNLEKELIGEKKDV